MASTQPPRLTLREISSHLGVMVALAALMGLLVAGLAIPFAGAIGVGAKSLSKSVKDLPEDLQTAPLAQRTRVLDNKGRTVATFYDQNRVNVTLDKIAPIMQEAIIAIEDDRFYEHGAFDPKGTLRAFLTNQANDGITQGGSSITQQMVKMTLLNQATTKEEREAATDDTYQRKIRELRYAIGVEQSYSKDWILERYLNIAYFGDGVYGIQSAARHYFGTDADKLNLRQAALLAGLVKNPVGYDPTSYPEKATERRNTVLRRMAELSKITPEQAATTIESPLGLKVTPTRNGCLGTKAPFFCDYVRRYLLADPSLGNTTEERLRLLNSGGLTIRTTLNLKFQKAADRSTASHVNATDSAIGALAMVKPGNGAVLAISQSRPMGRLKNKGQTFLNYVVDSQYGDSNGFQAGSTFKVFVLAAALEQGLPPSTSYNSPGTMQIPQNEFADCSGPYPNFAPWNVSNSTSSGQKNMYTGTRESVNTYFAQLEKVTGLCKPYALARAMGVDLTNPARERVPSFVLGIADVSPLEMAAAYATFAARGVACENRPVNRILNSDGKVFKVYPSNCKQVMAEGTADTVNDILRGVMEPGGFGSRLALNKPSAGKTGTIQENKAVWFSGYTPTVSTASMIAGANREGRPITLNRQTVGGQYIDSAYGSTIAGPMWADAMRDIQDDLPNEDFVRPTGRYVLDLRVEVRVPNVAGLSTQQAARRLENAGFSVGVGPSVASRVKRGKVAQTRPGAGAMVLEGTQITLYPSSGPARKQTPSPNNGNGNGNGNARQEPESVTSGAP